VSLTIKSSYLGSTGGWVEWLRWPGGRDSRGGSSSDGRGGSSSDGRNGSSSSDGRGGSSSDGRNGSSSSDASQSIMLTHVPVPCIMTLCSTSCMYSGYKTAW
jgi:hypothetical protein